MFSALFRGRGWVWAHVVGHNKFWHNRSLRFDLTLAGNGNCTRVRRVGADLPAADICHADLS